MIESLTSETSREVFQRQIKKSWLPAEVKLQIMQMEKATELLLKVAVDLRVFGAVRVETCSKVAEFFGGEFRTPAQQGSAT